MAALLLLSSIALWPEIARVVENSRTNWRAMSLELGSGVMVHPRYRGLDGRNQPYMVSAETAERVDAEKVNLHNPKGDVTLSNGTWLLVQAPKGVYVERKDLLDLFGGVTLYRQDGTTVNSAVATMDLKQGAGTSREYTHAEGPFGTLDAEGFTLVDKGDVIQFHGPAKLVLNSRH